MIRQPIVRLATRGPLRGSRRGGARVVRMVEVGVLMVAGLSRLAPERLRLAIDEWVRRQVAG